jgi:uncharacterized protein
VTRRRGDAANGTRRVSVSPRLRVWIAALFLGAQAYALEVPPPPTQWITDRAGILSGSAAAALNEKLRAFEQRSGAQFIIYIFPSLEGDSLEDFTIRAAERWKVGQKKYDNGLILFVFVKDRKTRIEVGYGLEPTITDLKASRALRTLAPYFQRGDYAGGLNAAADQLIAEIEGKEPPVPPHQPRAPAGRAWSLADFIFLLVIIFFILMFVAPLSRRGGCGGCFFPFFFPGGGVTFGGGGWSGGGGFGGFSGGGGSFGGGGASGSW